MASSSGFFPAFSFTLLVMMACMLTFPSDVIFSPLFVPLRSLGSQHDPGPLHSVFEHSLKRAHHEFQHLRSVPRVRYLRRPDRPVIHVIQNIVMLGPLGGSVEVRRIGHCSSLTKSFHSVGVCRTLRNRGSMCGKYASAGGKLRQFDRDVPAFHKGNILLVSYAASAGEGCGLSAKSRRLPRDSR